MDVVLFNLISCESRHIHSVSCDINIHLHLYQIQWSFSSNADRYLKRDREKLINCQVCVNLITETFSLADIKLIDWKPYIYQQSNSTSSPPMWKYLSGNQVCTSWKRSLRSLYVIFLVGSMGPRPITVSCL